MERLSVPRNRLRQHLSDHAGSGVELLQPDPLQRTRRRRRHLQLADAQGRMPALRRSRLPARVPGRRRHRAIRQRHRRFPAGQLHRLPVLRHRLPVQYSEVQSGDQEGPQVHAVFGSRGRGTGTGLHQGVSHRLPALRQQGRHEGSGRKARRRNFTNTRRTRTPASTIRRASAART